MNAQAWSVSQAVAEYVSYMEYQGILHDDGDITAEELQQNLVQKFNTLVELCMENGIQTEDEVFNIVIQFVLYKVSVIKAALSLERKCYDQTNV